MTLTPRVTHTYHVFLASPGDVSAERQAVRRFFDDYNRHMAHIWNAWFEVVDWENYSTIGVGRPQEIITKQTLEKYRASLALVIGIMAQRFGSPSGNAESGTQEEFEWAMKVHKETGFPEIKWFFRKIEMLQMPTDPDKMMEAVAQWQKVQAFRQRMQDLNDPVFYTEYPDESGFADVLQRDLNRWLAAPERPWAAELAARRAAGGAAASALPAEFRSELYRESLFRQFDKLNFEMLDTTGVEYNRARLWSVFVPQSVRESHQYNPRLLEIPKEHQQRLLDAGEITSEELEETERQVERLRQDYFSQPCRPVLNVIDEAFRDGSLANSRKLVILGDPGSGKSSLIRFLALRWAQIAEPTVRDTQPVPLVIELGPYGRWACDGQKSFIRYLEESQCWHQWPHGLLDRLIGQRGRVVLLLDGLDEIFDVVTRNEVINDIHRFSGQFPHLFIVVTSRVVGYQPQRLRDAEFRHFMLQDLDAGQIAAFIERWHEETFEDAELARPKRERLQKAIRDSKSIAMLAGNPLLLTMMAILNRNQELPRDRVSLYSKATELLLYQWDTERLLLDFPMVSSDMFRFQEKFEMLRRIAAHMQTTPGGLKGNMIDGKTLISLIEEYLHTELHFEQSREIANKLIDQLRQRNFILCFVGANSYAFVHRTFLEYFCAADIVHHFNIAKTLDIDGLIALFDQHCRDDDWREVLRLICGQIDEMFVGKIVEHLTELTPKSKWNYDLPLPEIVLAIQCLNEVSGINKLEREGAFLFDRVLAIYEQQAGNNTSSFHDAIKQAAIEIGNRWPGAIANKNRLLEIAMKYGGPFEIGIFSMGPGFPHIARCANDSRTALQEMIGTTNPAMSHAAIVVLVKNWPDDNTRKFLEHCAVQAEDNYIRSTSLQKLVDNWPDESTRLLLEHRAVQDESEEPRSTALKALAGHWLDDNTRKLLELRSVQDDGDKPRQTALQSLVKNWPDENTLKLLESQVSSFEEEWIRERIEKSIETLRKKLGVEG